MNVDPNFKRAFSQLEGENESPTPKYPKISSTVGPEKLAALSDSSTLTLNNKVSPNPRKSKTAQIALDCLEIHANSIASTLWSGLPYKIKSIIVSKIDFSALFQTTHISKEMKAIVDREIIERINKDKISLDTDEDAFAYLNKILKEQGQHLKYLGLKNHYISGPVAFGLITDCCPNLEEVDIAFPYKEVISIVHAIAELSQKSMLSHVRKLKLHHTESDSAFSATGTIQGIEAAKALAEICLPDLSELALRRFMLGDEGMPYVAELLKKSKIKRLNLKSNWIHSEGIEKIAPFLSKISFLNLRWNTIGTKGLELMLQAKPKQVDLNMCRGEANVLAESPLENLSEVNLSYCSLDDDSMLYVAELLKRSKVTSLNLSCNQITSNGIAKIAPFISKISILNLSKNQIGSKGLELILKAKPKLRVLNMFRTEIGDEGAQMIFNFENFKFMQKLDLSLNVLSSNFFSSLEEPQIESNLEVFYLNYNEKLINSDASKIAQSSIFSKLKVLGISRTGINNIGALEILTSLKQLKKMSFLPIFGEDKCKELVELAKRLGYKVVVAKSSIER
ncbi:MAG: hypothetical protein BGO14_01925 [Chlamydiales bacterium 38-26]|nr:hypothetical protein [Chlamydiales bacterium]OJV08201.1 MAG: hypothetical protein BGO14_01925 [Chlamydiales bacterium 38-26]